MAVLIYIGVCIMLVMPVVLFPGVDVMLAVLVFIIVLMLMLV